MIFRRKSYRRAGLAFDILEPFEYSDEKIYSTVDEEAAALKIEEILAVLAGVSRDDVVNSEVARTRIVGELQRIAGNSRLPGPIRNAATVAVDYLLEI